MIYLDNAATTRMLPEVLDAMLPYLTEYYGNAGSIYGIGRKASKAVERAREQVAHFVGASPEQIIFTSGGTEANNLAILGVRDYLYQKGKKHIITSAIEHDSVLRAVAAICNPLCHNDEKCIKDGFYPTYLGVTPEGVVSESEFLSNVLYETGLVSIMYVNNEVGSVNPVRSFGKFCRKNDILFHTDCVQAAGTHLLDVNTIGCDMMSISSHKIHGPKGVGALYVKDKQTLSPIIYGGLSQEFGARGGTENVAGIVGFGKACEIMSRNIADYASRTTYYKKLFLLSLCNELKGANMTIPLIINGCSAEEPGKVLNLTFKNIDAETLLLMLDTNGVCVSAGSACRSHESEPSHVLVAMGVSSDDARSSIRVSFSRDNSEEDVRRAAAVLASCIVTLGGVVRIWK